MEIEFMQRIGIPVAVDECRHDMDEYHASTKRVCFNRNDDDDVVVDDVDAKCRCEVIHSGQFMLSNIDEQDNLRLQTTKNDIFFHCYRGHLVEVETIRDHSVLAGAMNVIENIQDVSYCSSFFVNDVIALLTKITTIYSTKFCSPKWSDFKGVSLEWHEKIRLNNLVWREWHRQFISGERTILCGFTCSVDDPIHSKPQAVVLEGKYWKRKFDAVTEEYQQWRAFWRARRPRTNTTEKYFPEVMQQDDFPSSDTGSGVAQERQPALNLYVDALTSSYIPDSSYSSDLRIHDFKAYPAVGNSDIVLSQPSHDIISGFDLVKELFGSCETSYPAVSLVESQAVCFQYPTDVLANAVVLQQKMHADTSTANCYVPCGLSQSVHIASLDKATPRNRAPKIPSTSRTRRVNMLDALEALNGVLPLYPANGKLTKAKLLLRAADHCRQLRLESARLDNEMALARWNIDILQREVSCSQVVVSTEEDRSQTTASHHSRVIFEDWIRTRSSENPKFALFAELISPLFDSFMSSVCAESAEELSSSTLDWQRKHFSLSNFRQSLLACLLNLSKSTSFLASPDKCPQALHARTWNNESPLDDHFRQRRLS